ncbi:MAG: hypothetical protein A2W91_12740 [Bacteroidetes bacterium GWF2_38_335]|nr:MAG: hypothetical protein A2W91_12740 [Bacteroidetes bacterium GWF2_38_335]OFY77034.1 MAG: hypothetical protein A2281_00855 [Bacteroidetes bacterium RIFOXYA12_FULL_38_20]
MFIDVFVQDKISPGKQGVRLMTGQLRLIKVNELKRYLCFIYFCSQMLTMNKIRITGILMIFSLLLLTVFLTSWLINQYSGQRKLLVDDLKLGLQNSEQQVMDSLLAKQFIDPLKAEAGWVSIAVNSTESPEKINHQISSYRVCSDSAITNMYVDTIKMVIRDSSARMKINIQRDEKVLFQGMRMFVTEFGHIGADSLCSDSLIAVGLDADTLLLQNIFGDFMESRDYNFSVLWLKTNDTSGIDEENKIVLKCHYFNNISATEISGFRIFLLRKISTQIIFALVLLIVTALAFRMAYRSMRSQRRLLAMKNDFISNISHELKTPVSTVKVALEALKDFDMKNNPEVVNEYLSMSLQEMNRLDDLVAKILNATALEEGRNIVRLEKTDLNRLVTETLDSIHWQLEKSGAVVETFLEENLPEIMADPLHLRGVLVNLTDNAVKYSGEKPLIRISVKREKSGIVLSVADNGPGIPDEYLKKIFEKFFRVPQGNTHNVKGHGLGLYYAQVVAKQHNATLTARNLKEGGCELLLYFPDKP